MKAVAAYLGKGRCREARSGDRPLRRHVRSVPAPTSTTGPSRVPWLRRSMWARRAVRSAVWAFGDCVAVCAFDAIHINPATGLPEVDADKCTACGACVKACPKMIIELRKKWPKNRAVYVSCVSKDKGAVVMKACKAGCIGCGRVREGLRLRRHHRGEQPRLHRPAEVQAVPQVCERMLLREPSGSSAWTRCPKPPEGSWQHRQGHPPPEGRGCAES